MLQFTALMYATHFHLQASLYSQCIFERKEINKKEAWWDHYAPDGNIQE